MAPGLTEVIVMGVFAAMKALGVNKETQDKVSQNLRDNGMLRDDLVAEMERLQAPTAPSNLSQEEGAAPSVPETGNPG